MSVAYNPKIVKDGLVLYIDPANQTKLGASPYRNLSGAGSITNSNFQETENIWRSNANTSTGAGTSQLSITNIEVAIGSFTMIVWLKRTSNPEVGSNNNYRSVFMKDGTSQNPFGILMEETGLIQFSLTTAVRSYRYISGNFTQFLIPLNQWIQVVFSYDSNTGLGAAYNNDTLVRSGSMTPTGDPAVTPSAPGESALSLTTAMTYKISNSRDVSNPEGFGCFPGDVGPAMIYNRALTAAEVRQNFNAMRGRFGV
jgi:hypothetical protein